MEIVPYLSHLAEEIMYKRGFLPEFSDEEKKALSRLEKPAPLSSQVEDLRSLLWCSIDNDNSQDLDQLTYAEKNGNRFVIWVAIADVEELVKKDSPLDHHARTNTTSVYTPAKIFPMLPEKLSTNLTSLNENEDRLALVVKLLINPDSDIESASTSSSIFPALVHNYAKLTYNGVGDWLEGKAPLPKKKPGLEEVLRLQHEVAQNLKKRREEAGSLTLAPANPEMSVTTSNQISIQIPRHNFAHQLIEEFMIAANSAVADYFSEKKIAILRRVVRIPKNWEKIVEVALGYGEKLPSQPDSKALDAFLRGQQKKDPNTFADLSLTIIKLLGRGEYVVMSDKDEGHFALGLSHYTHFTAPNRRFPDLISQRQYKAFLRKQSLPYSLDELKNLAEHCTKQEDMAMKVERQLNKSAAAIFLSSQVGKTFQGIVTGVNEKGTWVRIFQPTVEGKIVQGIQNLNVGDKVTVQLKDVDIPNGFIDFILQNKS